MAEPAPESCHPLAGHLGGQRGSPPAPTASGPLEGPGGCMSGHGRAGTVCRPCLPYFRIAWPASRRACRALPRELPCTSRCRPLCWEECTKIPRHRVGRLMMRSCTSPRNPDSAATSHLAIAVSRSMQRRCAAGWLSVHSWRPWILHPIVLWLDLLNPVWRRARVSETGRGGEGNSRRRTRLGTSDGRLGETWT